MARFCCRYGFLHCFLLTRSRHTQRRTITVLYLKHQSAIPLIFMFWLFASAAKHREEGERACACLLMNGQKVLIYLFDWLSILEILSLFALPWLMDVDIRPNAESVCIVFFYLSSSSALDSCLTVVFFYMFLLLSLLFVEWQARFGCKHTWTSENNKNSTLSTTSDVERMDINVACAASTHGNENC